MTKAQLETLRQVLDGREYLFRMPTAIPSGHLLVHNHVRPTRQLGMRGFRAWLDVPGRRPLERCSCAWASELGPHYRVTREAA